MESPDAAEMRRSLQVVFHDLHHMRNANTNFKMKMNHWIKNLTVGIKSIIDGSTSKDLPISAKIALEKEINTDRLQHAKRCIVNIMLIHRVVYTDHIEHLLKEVRRSFLNQIFSGCLPKDIGKAKLYIADVLHLSASELKLFFKDRELIFTCSNAFSDQVEAKNDETVIDLNVRKRTLKRNMKKKGAHAIAIVSSRMK
jgi:hypothetical protein